MRMSRILALLALAMTVAACQTLTPEQQRAADEAQCSGYGFKRGTTPFADCLLKLDLDRRADTRAFMYSNDDDFFWGPGIVVGGGGYYHHHHWH